LWASTVAESTRSSPAKRWPALAVAAAGSPYAPIDVQPDPARGADVGEPGQVVHGPRERRARGGHHRDGRAALGEVGVERGAAGRDVHPAVGADREAPHVSAPMPSTSAARWTE